jgi:pyruvate,water dikinase
LGQWHAPILTDFFAMIFFGILRRLSERWLDPGGSLHNDLLAGDGAIESLEPVRRIMDLAQSVRADSRLRAAFSRDPEESLRLIQTDPQFASFRAALDNYLIHYGDRCMNELKLEEPNLRDDPRRLINLIASAVEHPTNMLQGGTVRTKAEARLDRLTIGRRVVFRWVLHQARRQIRNRENMRFARTRLFGLVRRLVNAVGAQWESAGVLEHANDIYFLTIGEIWDFVDGTAVTQNLRGLTALRRTEYNRHTENRSPDRFETFGVPYLNEPIDLLSQAQTDGDVLHGVGCCSGVMRGRARVVRSVDDITDLGGDILVAERTDPGWVFLFPSASGILVERGSPLSHSAIVAREMGKPTIVNIPALTARIQTGDHVEMDGEKGIVRVIKP